MKILIVSPEIAPFAKTGGLADMVGALSRALVERGVEVCAVMPFYSTVKADGLSLSDSGKRIEVPVSNRLEQGEIIQAESQGMRLFFIKHNRYFNRPHLYGTAQGDYPDNAERFVFFFQRGAGGMQNP